MHLTFSFFSYEFSLSSRAMGSREVHAGTIYALQQRDAGHPTCCVGGVADSELVVRRDVEAQSHSTLWDGEYGSYMFNGVVFP